MATYTFSMDSHVDFPSNIIIIIISSLIKAAKLEPGDGFTQFFRRFFCTHPQVGMYTVNNNQKEKRE